MPLNVENKQYVSLEEESSPKPITHIPQKQYHGIRYFLLGFFIITVVSSSVFLIYLFYLNINAPSSTVTQAPIDITASEPAPQTNVRETTDPAKTEQPSIPTKDTTQIISATPVKPVTDLTYTVYIGVYDTDKPAQDEVNRWNQAGFNASVVHLKKNYRVSLGKYISIAEADSFAKKWSDSFEYGYWIGTIE